MVLTGLFMSELNETFSIGSKYNFKIICVNFTGLRNQPVLQDSRMTLGGKTGLFMLELNETFSIGSKDIFQLLGINCSSSQSSNANYFGDLGEQLG